jgi:hypothetical protein
LISIRRMSIGTGYLYLMSSVAAGDGAGGASNSLTRYYAESGTPPGIFLGAGLAGLADGEGVEKGSVVTELHLYRMLGLCVDPVTGEPLGQLPNNPTRAGAGSSGRSRWDLSTPFRVAADRSRQRRRHFARRPPPAAASTQTSVP